MWCLAKLYYPAFLPKSFGGVVRGVDMAGQSCCREMTSRGADYSLAIAIYPDLGCPFITDSI